MAEPERVMGSFVAVVRWGCAVGLVAVLVVGVPALLAMGPQLIGTDIGVSSLAGVVAGDLPVTDDAFVSGGLVVGWVLWAYLSLAIVAEVTMALSGRAGAVIGLGPGQSLVRALVAAAMWSSTRTGLAVSSVGVGAIAFKGSPDPDRLAGGDDVLSTDEARQVRVDSVRQGFADPARLTMAERSSARIHVVEFQDTMWDLAQRHLGDPLRWREIAELNPDVDDLGIIDEGWVILLPEDAVSLNSAEDSENGERAPAELAEQPAEIAVDPAAELDEGLSAWLGAALDTERDAEADTELDTEVAAPEPKPERPRPRGSKLRKAPVADESLPGQTSDGSGTESGTPGPDPIDWHESVALALQQDDDDDDVVIDLNRSGSDESSISPPTRRL